MILDGVVDDPTQGMMNEGAHCWQRLDAAVGAGCWSTIGTSAAAVVATVSIKHKEQKDKG